MFLQKISGGDEAARGWVSRNHSSLFLSCAGSLEQYGQTPYQRKHVMLRPSACGNESTKRCETKLMAAHQALFKNNTSFKQSEGSEVRALFHFIVYLTSVPPRRRKLISNDHWLKSYNGSMPLVNIKSSNCTICSLFFSSSFY